MKLTVAATGGAFAVGDAFTIAGVYAVNMKNKQQTQELKTFRVIGVDSATQIEIVPAIVCDDGANPTGAEEAYKNVSATPAAGAAITMLNKKHLMPNSAFVQRCAWVYPVNIGARWSRWLGNYQSTLDNGLTVYYTRQGDINDLSTNIVGILSLVLRLTQKWQAFSYLIKLRSKVMAVPTFTAVVTPTVWCDRLYTSYHRYQDNRKAEGVGDTSIQAKRHAVGDYRKANPLASWIYPCIVIRFDGYMHCLGRCYCDGI